MFACSVFYCSLLILYFICIFLLLLPTWRIKLMMMMITSVGAALFHYTSALCFSVCIQSTPIACLPTEVITSTSVLRLLPIPTASRRVMF